MIHNIQNPEQGLSALLHANDSCEDVWSLVIFDIDPSVDAQTIPVTLCQCKTCDVTAHLYLGEEITEECPRCREETMKQKFSACLVLQGSKVWYADHRINPGKYML